MSKKPKKIDREGYLVGYARVSTEDQNLDLQLDALRKAGVSEDNLHVEKLSATAKSRPALDRAIKDLDLGDTLLVWRLDRFARSMRDLYARIDRVYAKGAKFRSITESFDFDTFTGKFVLGILGLVAELERQIIAHRTSAGIATWKATSGEDWGRQPKLTDKQIEKIGKELNSGIGGPTLAKKYKVSTATIYRYYGLDRRKKKFIRKPDSK